VILTSDFTFQYFTQDLIQARRRSNFLQARRQSNFLQAIQTPNLMK